MTYALINLRSKLDDKADKCIFIGYASQSKTYKLFDPVTGRTVIRRNVVFNEKAEWDWMRNEKGNVTQKMITIDSSSEEINAGDEADINELNTDSPLTQSSQSSPSSSARSTSSGSSSESPPYRKFRSLADIYERCG